jgi:hypothetical protein
MTVNKAITPANGESLPPRLNNADDGTLFGRSSPGDSAYSFEIDERHA